MSDLQVRGLTIVRGGVPVLRSLDLSVGEGSWTMVVGPNGAGKSSLLAAIAGLLPYEGEIRIGGTDVRNLHPRQRAQLVSVVPQRPELPTGLTVFEYALLGRTAHLSPFGREGRKDRAAVHEVLERLDLGWLASRGVTELSGGEVQRALIARSLVQQTRLLVLDEPTSALDIRHQQQALELVDALRQEDGLTVISALHDLTLSAQFGDRIALVACGELIAEGTPREVFTQARVSATYGADVVVRDDEELGLAVIPRRSGAGRVKATPAAVA